jgi:Flp pilus assembly protein TadG
MTLSISGRVRVRSQRGSVMVEFALLSPILVSLFLGVILFGFDFYTYNRLEEAVRSGARFASTQTYDVLHASDPAFTCGTSSVPCNFVLNPASSAFAQRVANLTVYGDPAGGTNPLISGLTTANITVALDVKNGVPTFAWVAVTGFTMQTPMGMKTLNGKPAAVFPYSGNFKASP